MGRRQPLELPSESRYELQGCSWSWQRECLELRWKCPAEHGEERDVRNGGDLSECSADSTTSSFPSCHIPLSCLCSHLEFGEDFGCGGGSPHMAW